MGSPGNQTYYPVLASCHALPTELQRTTIVSLYSIGPLNFSTALGAMCLTLNLTAAVQTQRTAHITYTSSNSAWGYSIGSNGRFTSLSRSVLQWMPHISPLQ